MEKFLADPDMFDRIQASLELLTLELFHEYIECRLWKGDIPASQLASSVWYHYDCRGWRFVELKSIAEQKRTLYYQRKGK